MKRVHFLIAVAILAFASCSTYKNSQTPDDVYYSQGAHQQGANAVSNNGEYYSTANDQYVHMLVQDRARWSYFDDYYYDYYGGFGASCFSSFNTYMMYGSTPWIGFGYWSPYTYWNSYYTWNTFYNPYYAGVVITSPNPKAASMPGGATSSPYTHLSTFSPTSYTNNIYARRNLNLGKSGYSSPQQPYNYSQTIRNNYSGGYYNNRSLYGHPNNYYSQPTRTYSPPSYYNSPGGMRTGGSNFGGGGLSRPSMGGKH
jgi:hypothetical protein